MTPFLWHRFSPKIMPSANLRFCLKHSLKKCHSSMHSMNALKIRFTRSPWFREGTEVTAPPSKIELSSFLMSFGHPKSAKLFKTQLNRPCGETDRASRPCRWEKWGSLILKTKPVSCNCSWQDKISSIRCGSWIGCLYTGPNRTQKQRR